MLVEMVSVGGDLPAFRHQSLRLFVGILNLLQIRWNQSRFHIVEIDPQMQLLEPSITLICKTHGKKDQSVPPDHR